MFRARSFSKVIVGLCLLVSLAACDSAEERAEEHFQRALAFIQEGDPKRAIVEFRNVFQIDGSHQEARHRLAELYIGEGNLQAAYSNYLRLVEQYPDDLKARIELSDLAFLARNWDEVERHGTKAQELAPDEPRVKAISLALRYRDATVDDDVTSRRALADEAVQLLDAQTENIVLRNMLVDNFMRDNEYSKALEQLDAMIVEDESNILYWRQRLTVLAQLGDNSGLEEQLRRMVELFPEDSSNKLALVRFFMSRQQVDKAEAFLRELAAGAPEDDPGPRLDVIRFLSEVRGIDAAKMEVRKAVSEAVDPVPYRVMGAGLDFSSGDRESAVETLEDVLKTAESSEQTRAIKVSLARMLLSLGNEVGARARVEEVLAEDDRNANALKMRAAWLIEADDTDNAIAALRIAIEEEPDDSQAMGLMATAYSRAGRPELARDYLALAVEASNNAPEETVRYVRLLLGEQSFLASEDLLKKSLRLNQNNVQVLTTMGELYLAMNDQGRAEQIVSALRDITTPQAQSAANGLQTEVINRFRGPEEAMTFLQELANSSDATLATRMASVRARLATGDLDGALRVAQELVDENQDSAALKSVLGATYAAKGQLDEAERIYRELVDVDPKQPNIWMALAQLAVRAGDSADGIEVVEEGLTYNPGDANLLWAKALHYENSADYESAIAIYEGLYEENSFSVIVANNLASMLSTYRTDDASLEQAWRIARRFRDAQIPAMQDTYGWIEHRRGNSETALPYLENAAQSLQDDAIVQYHLGEVYMAVGRNEDALEQFNKAISLALPNDERPQVALARERISSLENAQN